MFLDAYLNNQNDSNYEALESHPVGFAMYKFMEDKTVWSGSPTKLLSELEIVAGFEKIYIPQIVIGLKHQMYYQED